MKITDDTLMEFQLMITKEKINQLFEESQKYGESIKSKEPIKKINKAIFLSFFKKIFSPKVSFINLYNLIFEKFKERKCIFSKLNSDNSKNKTLYFLTKINTTGKIEIYIVQLFLTSLMKIKFKDKLEIMFNIVDSDFDGLINESEIKRLIYILHLMFAEESSEFNCESDLVKQSLSYMKAKKVFSELIYGKGELYKIIEVNHYITFEQFYDSITKIENYIYNIIPTFIEIKKCLFTKNKEIKCKINHNDQNTFVDISYELINNDDQKNYNATKFFKNCFDLEKKIPPKKRDFVKETKILLERKNISNFINRRYNPNLNSSGLNDSSSKILSSNRIKMNKSNYFILGNKKQSKIIPYTGKKTSNDSFETKNNSSYIIKNKILKNSKMENTNSNMFSFNISKIDDNSNSINENSIKKIIDDKSNISNKKNFEYKLIARKLIGRKSKSLNNLIINKNANNSEIIGNKQGDYYKFNNVVFPPCIIETKNTENKKEGTKLCKKTEKCSSSKNIKNVLKLDSEISNEINSILEQYKNEYKFYGMNIIRDLNKKIKKVKDEHPLDKFYNNKIGFNYFKFKKKKNGKDLV